MSGSADAEWEVLRARIDPGRTGRVAPPVAAPPQRRLAAIQDLRDRADDLRDFRERYPQSEHAKEARRQEALALLHLSDLGIDIQQARRDALIAEVRSDTSLATRERAQVVVFAGNLGVRRRSRISREERLVALEAVVREVIAEFPDVPEAYESLWSTALNRSDEAALAAVPLLLEGHTPEPVKQRARALVRRHDLLGKPIATYISADDATVLSAIESHRGSPLLIYSWAVRSRASMVCAKLLSRDVPAHVGLVGINLDRNTAEARAVANAEGLKGTLLFDSAGPDGATAIALAVDTAPVVLVVNPSGTISSVSGHRTLADTIAGLSTP